MKMIDSHHRLLVFNSIHRVMQAERLLQQEFAVLLIPVPRALSADCGMALRVDSADCAALAPRLEQAGLTPFSIYRPVGDAFELQPVEK